MRKPVFIILLAIFAATLNGCSLFSSDKEETETATVAEDGAATEDFAGSNADYGDEFASDSFESGDLDAAREEISSTTTDNLDFDAEAMAKDEGATTQPDDLFAEDVVVEDNFATDAYPDDDYGTQGASAAVASGDDFTEDFLGEDSFAGSSAEDALFVDEGASSIPSEPLATNQEEDLFGQDMAPVVDTPTDYADASYNQPIYDVPDVSPDNGNSGLVPVKKMKPAAYARAGDNVNRLYVTRPGDNMDQIAQKIYGDSSQAEKLYSYNSHFRGKTLKVGDKVYYQSPNSPNDPEMKTYYEDMGMEPQYYTSQEGDNLRKVSQKLLGHPRSWMEVWATNSSVESKWRLPAGLQLRYWPEQPSAAPVMAANQNSMPQEPTMPEAEPVIDEPAIDEPVADEVAAAPPEPEPVADMGNMAEAPQEVAMNDMAAGGMNDMPPPEDVEEVTLDDAEKMADLDDPAAFD